MTKIKMSNQAEQGSSAEFVEKRRASLERYLNRTAAHPILGVDPDFREFLEAGKLYSGCTNTEMCELIILCRRFSVGRCKNALWKWVLKHMP
jgi:sorting nexin-1/2